MRPPVLMMHAPRLRLPLRFLPGQIPTVVVAWLIKGAVKIEIPAPGVRGIILQNQPSDALTLVFLRDRRRKAHSHVSLVPADWHMNVFHLVAELVEELKVEVATNVPVQTQD